MNEAPSGPSGVARGEVRRASPGWGPRLSVVVGIAALTLLPGSAGAFDVATCPGGQEMRWYGGPSDWYLHETGYSQIEFEKLQAILQQGVETWSEPCCSNFDSRYRGTTDIGLGYPPLLDFLIFEEEKWPDELGGVGGATIASTLKATNQRCAISGAFMIFNGIDHLFRTPEEELGDDGVDLFSIAVHEFGHWLGLNHSDVEGAVMKPSYNRGDRFEGLTEDDIAGVCHIYPGSCEACGEDEDCPEGTACRGGRCALFECRDTFDCKEGTLCLDSFCVPGCRGHQECGEEEICLEDGSCVPAGDRCEKHVDCAPGESCVAGRCGPQPSSCTICKPCDLGSACGPHANCFTTPFGPRCTTPCEVDRDCVGDSVCRQLPGAPVKYCLDPGSGNDFCPASYECEVAEPGPSLGCALLGEPCTGGSFGCGGRSDTCYDDLGGAFCSCTCRSDEECGEGARCVVDPSDDLPTCYPEEAIVPCGETACAPGLRCGEAGCEWDPCAGVSCEEGERCEEGSCVAEKEPAAPAPKKKAKSSGCASAPDAGAGLLPLLLLAAAAGLRRSGGVAGQVARTRGAGAASPARREAASRAGEDQR